MTMSKGETASGCEVISITSVCLSESERHLLIMEFRDKARKLARSILRRWHSRMDLQEIDSVVDLSLCEATRRFDPDKGASFMTFLYYHLKGNLIRAVSEAVNQAGMVEREDGMDSAINSAEVAAALGSQEVDLPDESLYVKQLVGLSQEACRKLDQLEKEVINRLYMNEEQLIDIAASLGYSRCHISRVKKKAIESLQNQMSEALGEQINEAEVKFGWGRRKVHRRRPRSVSVRKEKRRIASAA